MKTYLPSRNDLDAVKLPSLDFVRFLSHSVRITVLWMLPLMPALAASKPGAGTLQKPTTLAAMRGRYRPLLIFAAPFDQQGEVASQIDALRLHRRELLDRQVLLVDLYTGGRVGIVDPDLQVWLPGEASTLRRRFHVRPGDFAVILLGKDGGEKFRSGTPITIDRLNRTIDAMPMRQEEVRSADRKP